MALISFFGVPLFFLGKKIKDGFVNCEALASGCYKENFGEKLFLFGMMKHFQFCRNIFFPG